MRKKYLLLFLFICTLTLLLQTAVRAAPPVRPSIDNAAAAVDWRFGVVESYESPGAANALGVGWTRVKFHWATTQQGGPGTWTPLVSDGQINSEIGAGRTVVGLLIGVPDWAWDNGLPRGLDLPYDDPNNTWAGYVREAVSRYNGRINHWIIWNEPDIRDQGNPGFTWPGSIEQFYQLQRVSYLAAKSVNPNAVIHLGAFAYFDTPEYIYQFMDLAAADLNAAGNNYYFDVMTAHLYFQPDVMFNVIQAFYGAAGSRGIPWKPVWLVETNAPPVDDPAWTVPNWTFYVSQQEQAAFMPQGLASALAAGAQRIAIYKLMDTPGDVTANPEPFGLLRMDGTRRPAFTTYQVAIQYLAGMQGVQRERWDAVGQIRLDQGSYSTTVLFSRLPAPQQAQVPATAASGVLVDMWGGRQSISAANGVFTVDLPGAICSQPAGDYCMIGGTTYYLVQAAEGGSAPGAPPPAAPPQEGNPQATAVPTDDAAEEATTDATAAPTIAPTETATAAGTSTATVTTAPTATATKRPTSTPTAVPTDTPAPTETPLPTATAVPPTETPTDEIAALPPTAAPTLAPTAAEPSPTHALSYWFLGGGALIALGLGGWWLRNGRR